MTTTDARAEYELCPDLPGHAGVQVLAPRLVPLGGPRAMTVRRTLPSRERSFVGAWCFVDHYGPDDVALTSGMDVPPHPHCGLQTVSWLFEGEVEHRDSGGVHALVRPGEVNLMTGGHGITHSEVSTPGTRRLHGVQLWVVLPHASRNAPRDFQHHAAPLEDLAPGVRGRVFVGRLAGRSAPLTTFTPLVGAELHVAPGTRTRLPVEPTHEHAVLVDSGELELCGRAVRAGELGVIDAGVDALELVTGEGADPGVRGVLLGGQPFEEEVVMWWNFIAPDHEGIVTARQEWEAGSDRFGDVLGYQGSTPRLPAPALPGVRLRARGRR